MDEHVKACALHIKRVARAREESTNKGATRWSLTHEQIALAGRREKGLMQRGEWRSLCVWGRTQKHRGGTAGYTPLAERGGCARQLEGTPQPRAAQHRWRATPAAPNKWKALTEN